MRTWDSEELEMAVRYASSWSQVCVTLGCATSGNSFKRVQRLVREADIPTDHFGVVKISKAERQRRNREANRSWYFNNKDIHKENVAKRRPGYVERNKSYVLDYLEGNPCVDCGISNILVLQFDHRPEEHKKACVTELMRGTSSIATIQAEIDKCDVRCSNCHILITAERAGNWLRSSR